MNRKKSEFKKMLKKENKALKKHNTYEMLLIFLLLIIAVPNLILTLNHMLPIKVMLINAVLVVIIAVPLIIIDIKNDREIKKMYQSYLQEKQVPEYQDKTKILTVFLAISIIATVVFAVITIPNILN